MGLLVQCTQCATMFSGNSPCPKCGHIQDPADAERFQKIQQEFQQRKQRRETNYAIYIGLVIGLGAMTVAVAGVLWLTRLWEVWYRWVRPLKPGEFDAILVPWWAAPVVAGLGIIGLILAILLVGSQRWWPGGLCCPSCEASLGGLKNEPKHCPVCSVQLQ